MKIANACCTTPGALCFWGAAFLVIYGAGLLAMQVWPGVEAYDTALLLGALGLACGINFARNRTYHCAITAPIFLLGAVAAGLDAAGVWSVPENILWPLVMIGVGAAFLLEFAYTQRQGSATRQ